MPLLSWEEHIREGLMTLVKVKALRGFISFDGKMVSPGDEIVVPKNFAAQLRHALQAEILPPELKAVQTPAPLETQDAQPLETQVPGGAKNKSK